MIRVLKKVFFSLNISIFLLVPASVLAQDPIPPTPFTPETQFERQQRERTFRDPQANPFLGSLIETSGSLPTGLTGQRLSPFLLIGNIIRVLLGFLGIGTIILMLWSGAQWMTAGGNEDRVSKAKRTLRNGVIGLIIILSGYSLSTFLIGRLERQTIGGRGGINFTIGEGEDFTSPRFNP